MLSYFFMSTKQIEQHFLSKLAELRFRAQVVLVWELLLNLLQGKALRKLLHCTKETGSLGEQLSAEAVQDCLPDLVDETGLQLTDTVRKDHSHSV